MQLVSAWDDEEDEDNKIETKRTSRTPTPQPGRTPAQGHRRRPRRDPGRRVGKVAEGLCAAPEVLKLDRPTEMVEVVAAEDPDVIVLGLEEVTGAGLKSLAVIHRAQPKIVIVLSDNRRKTWTAAQMAASGASDFIPPNPSKARLRTKLQPLSAPPSNCGRAAWL